MIPIRLPMSSREAGAFCIHALAVVQISTTLLL